MNAKIALALSTVALFAASPASATAVIEDLSSPGFSYGTLTSGTFANYTAYTPGSPECLGLGACYRGADTYAIIAASGNSGSLLVHPGPGAGGNSAVQYTVTNGGDYRLSALFTSADYGAKSVGYFTIIGGVLTVYNSGSIFGGGNPPTNTFGTSQSVLGNFTLGAGDSLGIFVNNGDGNYFNDSTDVSGTITAVPEAATWAMMLVGFGMIGFAIRRRRLAKVAGSYA